MLTLHIHSNKYKNPNTNFDNTHTHRHIQTYNLTYIHTYIKRVVVGAADGSLEELARGLKAHLCEGRHVGSHGETVHGLVAALVCLEVG
jgi:hypothetical protein